MQFEAKGNDNELLNKLNDVEFLLQQRNLTFGQYSTIFWKEECIDEKIVFSSLIYRGKLNKWFDSSLYRCCSSIIFITSPAVGHVLAIFCTKAVVVVVLKRPTARLFNPCKRHASTAAWRSKKNLSIIKKKTFENKFTTKRRYATVFFMNTFFHHSFFHHLFDLNEKRRKEISSFSSIVSTNFTFDIPKKFFTNCFLI